jgi:putative membrane protein
MWRWYEWSWWSLPLMTFGMLLAGGLLAWLVVVAVRNARPNEEAGRPEQILAERFARGEIDEAEYEQRLAALRASSSRP